MRRAVVCYDLSGNSGWAVYHPDLDEPRFGTLRLPKTTTGGSDGPAFQLLFDHISWVNTEWPLMTIGYEAFIAPTGTKKDDDKGFATNPHTLQKLIGYCAVAQMCASMLEIDHHSINNMSWKKYWLGSHPRGTDRKRWKELSLAKAKGMGWAVKNNDESDALGQLHFLLFKLNIRPRYGRNPSQELIRYAMENQMPLNV